MHVVMGVLVDYSIRRTPLILACDKGHGEAVKVLLAQGANPNMILSNQWCACVRACVCACLRAAVDVCIGGPTQ